MFDLIHTVDSLRLAAGTRPAAPAKTEQAPGGAGPGERGRRGHQVGGRTRRRRLPLVAASSAALEAHRGQRPHDHAALLQRTGNRCGPSSPPCAGCRDRIRAEALPNVGMEELSMGMTGDFEAAIAEGATLVQNRHGHFRRTIMKLLLHTCCGPAAIFPVRELRADGMTVTGFFYPHNIHPYTECRDAGRRRCRPMPAGSVCR
ncbi:MAG: epoxyqueuosine reductase QueH [Desulfomicrobium escambiense]|nr:epoxyqueuosine reductase QueH [Desulfomicrobium escambiense]